MAIFVEGGDEERMIQRVGSAVPTFFVPFHGRSNLANLTVAASNDPGWPGISRIGVVLDAEDDPVAAWKLVIEVFDALHLAPPSSHGLVEARGAASVGAFVLPDGVSAGASERLLVDTVDPAVLACVDAFFSCTPNPGTTAALRDKARAQAVAAATVAGARPEALWDTIDPKHATLGPLRRFLHDLAGVPVPP